MYTNPNRFPKHILCGLDIDGHANHATIAAVWLSENLGAALEFVHAFPPHPILWGKEKDMPEWMEGKESAEAKLREALLTALAAAPKELCLRTQAKDLSLELKTGPRAQVLLERARAHSADLIVLGAHHKHGGLDFDNTVRAVLAHAPRGVWVQPNRPQLIRSILVPVDMSKDSLAALATARDLALALDAQITVLQAFEMPVLGASFGAEAGSGPTYVLDHLVRAERAQFEVEMSGFDWRGVVHELLFEQGAPARTVLARESEHDLVVMGTHGRTGLSSVLLGSVAHDVLRSSRIPVLALRFPGKTFLI